MFGSKSKETMAGSTAPTTSGAVNLIAAGTVIEGEIKSNGDIRIDGTLKGSVTTNGKVIIGESGSIEGSAKCKNAEILGNFKGDINVAELLFLKATSKLNGDIVANKLAIDPGATFTGGCSMGEVKSISQPQTETKQGQASKTA